MKKILALLIIISLLGNLFVPLVLAQDASSAAQAVASESAQQTASSAVSPANQASKNIFLDDDVISPDLSQPLSLSQSLSLADVSGSSAAIRGVMQLQQLAKKIFQASEDVTVVVDNVTGNDITTKIFDTKGKEVFLPVTSETVGMQTTLTLHPGHALRPGKYTVQVTDKSGTVSKQDFSWGILAINTDKSLYAPSDTAYFAMAVLDEAGKVVCDADVTLTIMTPQQKKVVLRTADNSISVHKAVCQGYEVTDIPDYSATYQVGSVGTYNLELTAQTKNGSYTVTDSFAVKERIPFSISRKSATRIYPYNTYPMDITVTAAEDFNGVVTETLPASFTVSEKEGSIPFSSSMAVLSASTPSGLPQLPLPFHGNHPISQGFGVALTDPQEKALYEKFGLAGHDGIDFDMPIGTPVYTVDSGKVVLAGEGAYGTTVVIQHSWGRSYYGHLSTVQIKVGDTVEKGAQIALSGNTGLSTDPHLHFGIKPNNADMQNGYYGKIDPSIVLPLSHEQTSILGASVSMEQGVKKLSWNVSMRKGETITLGYRYTAPLVSPQFYTVGPLQFTSTTGQDVFTENREWQIAADDVSGPRSATSTGDCVDATGVGTVTWTNPGNAFSTNATYATASVDGTTTHYIKCTNFGFTIPSTATINGVVVSVTRKSSSTNNGGSQDAAVRLVKAGTIGTTDRSTTTVYTTSDVSEDHGTSSDLWGDTWGPSDINNSTFGAAFAATKANAAGSAQTVSVDVITITVTYTLPPAFTQAAYLFSNTIDSSEPNAIIENPSGTYQATHVIALDAPGGYMYTGGDDEVPGNYEWRIEKRRIADGSLVSTFGTNGVIQENLSSGTEAVTSLVIDTVGGYLYAGGYDAVNTNSQWRLEKRNLSDGSLVSGFGTGGVVQENPSANDEEIDTLALDASGGYIYAGGFDRISGDEWRLEKRSTSDGSLVSGFGTGGVVTSDNTGSGGHRLNQLGLDTSSGYIYLAGYGFNGTSDQWKIEKRNTSDGSYVTGFGSSGVVIDDPTTGHDQLYTMGLDLSGGYMYLGGRDDVTGSGDYEWRFEKRNLSDGSLVSGFGTGGVVQENPSANDDEIWHLKVDTANSAFYTVGFDKTAGSTDAVWRIEKRSTTTGSLVSGFGSGGIISTNYTTGQDDIARDIAIDPSSSLFYVVGYDSYPGTYTEIRIEKRSMSDGSFSWGSSLAAQNTAATLSSSGSAFRLQELIHISNSTLSASGQSFMLQYVDKGSGSCSAPSGGTPSAYTNVTSSTLIAFKDNLTPSDGATLYTATSLTNGSDTLRPETYEEANNFTNSTAAINAGESGRWDFALYDNSAPSGKTYCFRVVQSDSTVLTYSVYPQITTYTPTGPTLDQLMRHGKWFNNGVEQPFTF